MTIKKAIKNDLERCLEIYANAREFMRQKRILSLADFT